MSMISGGIPSIFLSIITGICYEMTIRVPLFSIMAVNNSFFANELVGTYTESGFTLSEVNPNYVSYFGNWGTRSQFYPGSTALFNNNRYGTTRLTQVGGGAFNLSSIDLTDLAGNTSTTVLFTGRKTDGSNVSQSFTTDAITTTLQTFNFTNFTNLIRVDWNDLDRSGNFAQFDNINVSAVSGTTNNNTTAVPEPLTVLGAILGMGSGIAMKRKLTKAQDN
jgi:hypothetical protein